MKRIENPKFESKEIEGKHLRVHDQAGMVIKEGWFDPADHHPDDGSFVCRLSGIGSQNGIAMTTGAFYLDEELFNRLEALNNKSLFHLHLRTDALMEQFDSVQREASSGD